MVVPSRSIKRAVVLGNVKCVMNFCYTGYAAVNRDIMLWSSNREGPVFAASISK